MNTKKRIFYLCISICLMCSMHINAQGSDELKAKLEYTEAEKLFNNKKYTESLQHLNRTEKLLGRWTPNVAYLRVLCMADSLHAKNSFELFLVRQDLQRLLSEEWNDLASYPLQKAAKVYDLEKEVTKWEKVLGYRLDDYKNNIDLQEAAALCMNEKYTLAIEILKKQKDDNPTAMVWLGMVYRNGYGVEKNYTFAYGLYEKAAKMGSPLACYLLGDMICKPLDGIPADYYKAKTYYNKAMDMGAAGGYTGMAWLYLDSNRLGENLKEAIALTEKAVDINPYSANALMFLGKLYWVESDMEKASRYFTRAADLGQTEAMAYVGVFCIEGIGMVKNEQKGIDYLTKAANSGNGRALASLGREFFLGRVINRDCVKSVTYLEEAANKGEIDALGDLGFIYYYASRHTRFGYFRNKYFNSIIKMDENTHFASDAVLCEELKGNLVKAINFWMLAAEKGDINATYNLYSFYDSQRYSWMYKELGMTNKEMREQRNYWLEKYDELLSK